MLDKFTTKPHLDSLVSLWSLKQCSAVFSVQFSETHKNLASICFCFLQLQKAVNTVSRHAIFSTSRDCQGGQRLRDKPKDRLRGRLTLNQLHAPHTDATYKTESKEL